MLEKIMPFKKPIYITRPILPDLNKVVEKLTKIWNSKWLSNNGYQHNLLEKKLLKYLKVPFLSLFNNGTTALITACKCLDLKYEVITTPFTFPATPNALIWNNIKPIFCDINPKTMNIDVDKIESLISTKTTGILAVHVFGTPCKINRIEQIAKKYRLKIIYDAAHSFGVEIDGKGIGNFGDITMFSFHATKLFHTCEGGALTYNNMDFNKELALLKNFGIKNENEVILPGLNGKMNEIQAAIGICVLEYIEEEIYKRQILYSAYKNFLNNIEGISFIDELPNVKKSYQYFVIKINEKNFGKSRDYIYENFKSYNIFTRKYFFPLCSEYPFYKNLPSANPKLLPNAHKIVDEVLTMPFYGELYVEDIENICKILKSFRNS